MIGASSRVVALLVLFAAFGCSSKGSTDDGGVPGDGGQPRAYPLTLTAITTPQTQTANISLFFSVTDANKMGVSGLTKGDFAWTENDMSVDPTESAFDVSALAGNALDMPTILLLQTSPSIIQNGELATLKTAAKTIISAMRPEQRMAVLTFADAPTPTMRQPLTTDKTQLDTAIDAINTADGTSTNLYGSLIYALNMWQDGFANNGTSGQLTAGLVIVITNGSDNAARSTLQDVISKKKNKRVLAVGIGTDTTLNAAALRDITSPIDPIIAPSYAALSNDIGKVTTAIQSLATSVYTASYCSPKRAGANTLKFTVRGNESFNGASCKSATFPPQAVTACVSLDNDFTQPCSFVNNTSRCCPVSAPYACLTGTSGCYATAQQAANACGSSCLVCGGDGSGQDLLVPGPQIIVNFNASTYSSGQCPALWGPTCKGASACCTKIGQYSFQDASSYQQQCTMALGQALGNETQCAAVTSAYCPMAPPCSTASSCCSMLPTDPSALSPRQQCFSQLFSAMGNTNQCTLLQQGYCPSGASCGTLKGCCDTFAAQAALQCYQTLQSCNQNEGLCTQQTPRFCPSGPNCTKLKGCCAKLMGAQRDNCEQSLIAQQGNEAQCLAAANNIGCQ